MSRFKQVLAGVLSSALVLASLSLSSVAQAYTQAPKAPDIIRSLALAPTLGVVTESYKADTGKCVILVQDLHLHYPTQKRILKILDHLYARNLITGPIAIEGLQGDYDTAPLASFPAGEIKDKLVDYFMRKGELSGDEAFAILRGESHRLQGVDDGKFYALNRGLYKSTLANRKSLEGRLARIQNDLAFLKKKHYNRALRALDRTEAYDVASAQQLLDQKLATAKSLAGDKDPKGAARVRNIIEIDHSLHFLDKLLRQETTLEEVRYVAQRLPQFVQLTQALLKLNTPSDAPALSVDDLEETLKSAVDFYAVALMRDKPLAENTLALLNRHGDAGTRGRGETSPRVVVLVAGGFHTAGVTRALKKAGVGYAVITPNVNEQIGEEYHRLYERRIAGEKLTAEEVAHDFRVGPVRNGQSLPRADAQTLRYLSSLLSGTNPEAPAVIETASRGIQRQRTTWRGLFQSRKAAGAAIQKAFAASHTPPLPPLRRRLAALGWKSLLLAVWGAGLTGAGIAYGLGWIHDPFQIVSTAAGSSLASLFIFGWPRGIQIEPYQTPEGGPAGGGASSALVEKVAALSRAPGGIVAGVGLADSYGRVFQPDGRFFTPDGDMNADLKRFMDSLSDKSVQEMIKAGIMYYDIRSGYWREHPEFTVAFAQAFAKKMQEKNGKKDGLVIHIAVDAYRHHFETAQVFADAMLRTGITDNGGGIYYWGVRNGGSIRNYAQLYQATHHAGGDWVFFTQSHRTETDLVGAKLGIDGEVFCGPQIRHVGDVNSGTLFDGIIDPANGHAPIKHKRAGGPVINVADTSKNDLKVAADMIRATSARGRGHIPDNQLLAGAKLYVPVMGRSIAMDVVKLLRGLGADVAVDSETVDPNVSPKEVLDPNEHNEPHVLAVNQRIDQFAARGEKRVGVFVDPDGDRGGLSSKMGDAPAVTMPGSEVVQLVIEDLASSGKPVTAISDMRTGLGAKDLEKALRADGRRVTVVPFEAGYSFFMKGMSELPADVAIENTLHFFTNPMTNTTWGAPRTLTRPDGKGFQGGDDAGLSSAYVIGAMVHQWEGQSPIEQLKWIQERYQLAPTVTGEKKPALKREDDLEKYHIADRMKRLAKAWFGGRSQFQINFNDPKVEVVSGVHLVNNLTGAMMLARYSNSGPGFTISGEAYKGKPGHEKDELNEMLGLGYLLMDVAVQQLRSEGHRFTFDWKDAADLRGSFDPAKYGISIQRPGPPLDQPSTQTGTLGHLRLAWRVGRQPVGRADQDPGQESAEPGNRGAAGLRLEVENIMSSTIGPEHGLTDEEWHSVDDKLVAAHSKYAEQAEDDETLVRTETAWRKSHVQVDHIQQVKEVAADVQRDYEAGDVEDVVIVGIGGSYLGARAWHEALNGGKFYNGSRRRKTPRIHFVGNNSSPDEMNGLFDNINLKKTRIIVTSKSGGTPEPLATYLILRDRLIKELGVENYGQSIIAVTGLSDSSALFTENKELQAKGYTPFRALLPVPNGVGGRYSVFSPVGLIYAAVAGLDVDKLIAGFAKGVKRANRSPLDPDNIAYQLARAIYVYDVVKGKYIVDFMPYDETMGPVGDWEMQGHNESLGKKRPDGTRVRTVLRALVGSRDNHSTMQQKKDGEKTALTIFTRVNEFKDDLVIPAGDAGKMNYLDGMKLGGHLLKASQMGTAQDLTRDDIPSVTLVLPEKNEEDLGEYMFTLMMSWAILGELYGINAFDQPGVEGSKIETRNILLEWGKRAVGAIKPIAMVVIALGMATAAMANPVHGPALKEASLTLPSWFHILPQVGLTLAAAALGYALAVLHLVLSEFKAIKRKALAAERLERDLDHAKIPDMAPVESVPGLPSMTLLKALTDIFRNKQDRRLAAQLLLEKQRQIWAAA
ncbi:MAG: hypothetical protein A2992_03420 [Elusimicrobia bacterium RIFCSPLOWO2_01_FULL_59_12]|nr:MAG: hypothetical protein A2992_03420 [Elusimicrobia bacterium RIFCSPLOWO2_01_FULL_59_12]